VPIFGGSSPAIDQKAYSMHQWGENEKPGFLDLRLFDDSEEKGLMFFVYSQIDPNNP
jgi:hypothetical protein